MKMTHPKLIEAWQHWEARNDGTIAIDENGNQYIWAFKALFKKQACNTRLCSTDLEQLKHAYLNGQVKFETDDLESIRLQGVAELKKAA